jgi:hypothetical protein
VQHNTACILAMMLLFMAGSQQAESTVLNKGGTKRFQINAKKYFLLESLPAYLYRVNRIY